VRRSSPPRAPQASGRIASQNSRHRTATHRRPGPPPGRLSCLRRPECCGNRRYRECFRLPASAKAPVRAQKRADVALTAAGGHGYPGTHRVAVAGAVRARKPEEPVPGADRSGKPNRRLVGSLHQGGTRAKKRGQHAECSRGRAASDSSGPTFSLRGGPAASQSDGVEWSSAGKYGPRSGCRIRSRFAAASARAPDVSSRSGCGSEPRFPPAAAVTGRAAEPARRSMPLLLSPAGSRRERAAPRT
jgi:hypothetical protein